MASRYEVKCAHCGNVAGFFHDERRVSEEEGNGGRLSCSCLKCNKVTFFRKDGKDRNVINKM
ncbi:MAG: hypothetical protein DRH26_01820 [Deltaproteobacteria bacterium]|nr:MAG: hypothetical protein DRH26_01820 [Deltaproteobacteria bacterium]